MDEPPDVSDGRSTITLALSEDVNVLQSTALFPTPNTRCALSFLKHSESSATGFIPAASNEVMG